MGGPTEGRGDGDDGGAVDTQQGHDHLLPHRRVDPRKLLHDANVAAYTLEGTGQQNKSEYWNSFSRKKYALA